MPRQETLDERSRECFGVDVETLTKRILRVFDRATVEELEAGASWYGEAQGLAEALGSSSGYGRDHAAAVIAHLSPRARWPQNRASAITLMTYGERHPGTMTREYNKARESLLSNNLVSTFNGPKTRRFFLNIVGDTDAVTVDVWACRAAGINVKALGRAGAYDAAEAAYQRAARRRGVSPSTMQAICWVVVRGAVS